MAPWIETVAWPVARFFPSAARVCALALALLPVVSCASPDGAPLKRGKLGGVTSWAIQLQGLTGPGAVERAAFVPVDMIVIDPTRTVRGFESFPTREVVGRLRQSKLCIAYLNVGQAEDYRTYWRNYWKAPGAGAAGSPAYLLSVDPEGWVGNYPVAYWDFRWKAILWGSGEALLDEILADGFDGVYLDWVLGYEDAAVAAAAKEQGVDPKRAMAELVRDLRDYARRRDREFLVIAQNGADLIEAVPAYAGWIDGIAHESVWFGGRADAKWEDAGSGDLATPAQGDWSTATLLRQLAVYRAAGIPVFTLDYAADATHAQGAREQSRANGFVPCISRTPLDRLP